MIWYVAIALAGALVGVFIALFLLSRRAADVEIDVEHKVSAMRERVGREAKQLVRTAELEVRQETLQQRNLAEQEIEDANADLAERELELAKWEEELDCKEDDIREWQQTIAERTRAAEKIKAENRRKKKEAEKVYGRGVSVLEEKVSESVDQIRDRLVEAMVEQFEADAADQIRNLESEVIPESSRLAKRTLGISIGRYEPTPAPPRVPGSISLSKADREWIEKGGGAKVLSELEAATDVTAVYDAVEGTLRMESPDGVARELARRAVAKLFTGKARGGERVKVPVLVGSLKKEISREIKKAGLKGFKMLGLEPGSDEVVDLVGRLTFRTSYAQNQFHHAVEAAVLAGLMASELGADVKTARRAGLLHDIGKAVTHEVDGSHALIGAELASRYGEDEELVEAIAAHHDDRPAETVLARLIAAADAASGARPGARRELVEAYVDRIQDLERLAKSFKGVSEAYAVQAGRELRVVVDEKSTDDERAMDLASRIAQKVSEKMVFPGQIRITVIRQTNAVAVAS
jgi:ribonuclease Y